VLSHLHQDHIGGLPEFRDAAAEILVSHQEWQFLQQPLPEPRGLLRSHIQRPGLHWRRIELAPTDDPGLVPFTAGHPLFGDGAWRCCPRPATRLARCRCWSVGRTGRRC
jgi:N-acyl homoserine lactone hydrolase